MRMRMMVMLVGLTAAPASAQTPATAPVDSVSASVAAAMADARAKEDFAELLKAQKRGPEPAVVDPSRDEREKAWAARCKPRLVAAGDGMQRYVYAFPDCAGRELSR
jgi:hypothetical protein